MRKNQPGSDLSDQLKKDLKNAETKEELDVLVSSAGMELDDDQLDAVTAGGCYDFDMETNTCHVYRDSGGGFLGCDSVSCETYIE